MRADCRRIEAVAWLFSGAAKARGAEAAEMIADSADATERKLSSAL
jgi:hypothetical protein